MVEAFKEDFFERIINVKWTDEKKVFWICGDASQATYSVGSKWWTSSDGKNWSVNAAEAPGLGGYACGLWMRENFDPESGGLWILGGDGVADPLHRKAGIQIGRDGVTLPAAEWFDVDHFVGQFHVTGEVNNGTATREDIWYDHADIWTSTDGTSWSGGLYHPEWGTRSARAPALTLPSRQIVPVKFDLPDDFEAQGKIPFEDTPGLDREQVLRSAATKATRTTASPRNPLDQEIKQYKLWDIYQLSNRNTAMGTMREGPGAGKVVKMQGGTPVGWHGPGSAAYSYFGPDCKMTDAKSGKLLRASNCGVQYGRSLAYGYYTFVVAGGDAKGNSVISHTEDGITWTTQILHPKEENMQGYAIWSLVVGPQPSEDKRR